MSAVATAVVVALAAAVCFAVANVAQHHGASQAPRDEAFRPSLVWHLLRRPVWLVGIFADLVGLGLHALALSAGALAVIQPLLVSGLLFALPVSRLVTGRRIRAAEYGWAGLIVAGLSVFLLAAHPTGGTAAAAGPTLGAGCAGAAALVVLTVAAAQRRGSPHRVTLLGVATGTSFGVVAALVKQATSLAALGLPVLLTSWPLYALLAAGAAALLLSQTAYQAGPLTASLPAMTIFDPIVGIALGMFAFGETVAGGTPFLAAALTGFAAMTVGVVQLARSSVPTLGQPGPSPIRSPAPSWQPAGCSGPRRVTKPSAVRPRVRNPSTTTTQCHPLPNCPGGTGPSARSGASRQSRPAAARTASASAVTQSFRRWPSRPPQSTRSKC